MLLEQRKRAHKVRTPCNQLCWSQGVLFQEQEGRFHYPLATFAGYHFANHEVNNPSSTGAIELISPV